MKILFWLNGSGGQRREREVVTFALITKENIHSGICELNDILEEWKKRKDCQSEIVHWGWDENFDPVTLEPLSKEA